MTGHTIGVNFEEENTKDFESVFVSAQNAAGL